MSRPPGLRRPGPTDFLILALNPAANTLSLPSAFPSNSRPVCILGLRRPIQSTPRTARFAYRFLPRITTGHLSDKHQPLLQTPFLFQFSSLQPRGRRCHGGISYIRGLGAMEERYPYPLHPSESSLVRALGGHRDNETSLRLPRKASSCDSLAQSSAANTQWISKRQYEYRFRQWGLEFEKNMPGANYGVIKSKVAKRKLAGKESNVFWKGKRLHDAKLEKDSTRHGYMTTLDRLTLAARGK